MKKKSSTAFLTTLFPAALDFFPQCLDSLAQQTNQNFDVLVVNDRVPSVAQFSNTHPNLHLMELPCSKSPAENRLAGVQWAKDMGYKQIIFGDADDFFDSNRVAVCKKHLKTYDVVINDLSIYQQKVTKDRIFSNSLSFPLEVPKLLLDANICGLSNTAINTSALEGIPLEIESPVVAFDWYFFTLLLVVFSTVPTFTSETTSYYRQYEFNTVGMEFQLSNALLDLGIRIKKEQYQTLLKYCRENNRKVLSEAFQKRWEAMVALEKYVTDPQTRERYIERVNAHIEQLFKGWWSQILPLKELQDYESTN